MSQRTFLGLTHNPFVPPKEGFFAGADRKTHLEHLRHLSQWSRRILVVTGPYGIGKSSLFRELSANLEPQTKAARLAGTLVTTEREVLAGLLQGFGAAADSTASADDLGTIIGKYVDEQNDNGRVCMVMVDDGHLLEPGALTRLINLVSSSSLRMVVFAETSVVGVVDRLTKSESLEWFEIRLTGFPKTDVRDYLEWRFSQAQYRGLLPYTDEQLDKIATKSSGNPGVIDSIASNLLIEMETGEQRNRRKRFPFLHGVLALLLVAFVGLVYVLLEGGDGDDVTQVAQAVNTESQIVPIERTDGETLGSPSTELNEQIAVSEPANDTTESIDVAQEGPDTVTTADAQDTSPATPFEAVASEAAAVDEPELAQVETVEATTPMVQESTEAVVNESTESLQTDGYNNGAWILEQDAGRYTVQLVTVSKLTRAHDLIAEQADTSEFAVYQINRDNRRLNVITFGVFSTTDAARRAADGLVGQLKGVKPWVRSLNFVQDAVRGGMAAD